MPTEKFPISKREFLNWLTPKPDRFKELRKYGYVPPPERVGTKNSCPVELAVLSVTHGTRIWVNRRGWRYGNERELRPYPRWVERAMIASDDARMVVPGKSWAHPYVLRALRDEFQVGAVNASA